MSRGYAGSTIPKEIRDSWQTPDFAFTPLDDEFNFALDAATNGTNSKVPGAYLTKEMDALKQDWSKHLLPFCGRAVWINPPYSDIEPWLDCAEWHARKRSLISVLLIPHTPDSTWWPYNASEIRVVRGARDENGKSVSGRIQFIRADTGKAHGNQSKGSCYVIYAPGTLGNMTTKYVPITWLKTEHERLTKIKKAA